jgi:hypothetical protein
MSPYPEELEWIAARYQFPSMIREEGENIQPDLVFWMAMPRSRHCRESLVH